MQRFISFFKKKVVYVPLGIIILLVGGIAIYGAIHKPHYETAKAEHRAFSQEVSVTGKVVAAQDVSLGFETGGRVTAISVAVGQKVFKGQALAYVSSGDLYGSLLDQQARLESAQAELAEVERGTRPTELANLEDEVEQAETNLEDAVSDSYVDADNVLRSKIDTMFTDPVGPYPRMVSFGNGFKQQDLEDERVEVGKMMNMWKKSLETRSRAESLAEAENNLKTMREFLDNLAVASSYFEDSSNMTEAEQEAFKTSISSGRSTINTAISSLNAVDQSLEQAKNALVLSKEGSTPEEIQRAWAAVKSAQANVIQAQAALAKASITAPFAGIVTKIDLRVGQQASLGSPVISMISNANFEIESFIPEADIAKVKVGAVGTTTLDAYGDSVPFFVVVTAIDLSETEVEGVSTYKTTLQFVSSDDRIRSGMTANIDLLSETRQGVLSIPQEALITKAGKRNVLVVDVDGKTKSREIKTGAIDNSGNIEVTGGLDEGEIVVTNPPK